MACIRPAELSDIGVMADLLVRDAQQRSAGNPALWRPAPDAHDTAALAIRAAMTDKSPPFRQQWLVADAGGEINGIAHTILLPVPPIYAGLSGAPGLIMEDCYVAGGAPDGVARSLFRAAEADLVEAGARILLASSVAGGAWAAEYAAANYAPLTLYLAKTGLDASSPAAAVRKAQEDDVPAIVASSARNRNILFHLDAFWRPHPDADARFGNWMKRSLTLQDRDMFVPEDGVQGYAIAQPATALHVPAASRVAGIGFVDDFFHADFADPGALENAGSGARALLGAAEAALAARGNGAALVVCPAAWASKIKALEKAGYATAITWHIKR